MGEGGRRPGDGAMELTTLCLAVGNSGLKPVSQTAGGPLDSPSLIKAVCSPNQQGNTSNISQRLLQLVSHQTSGCGSVRHRLIVNSDGDLSAIN
jgi:hypothetical protein